MKVTSEVWRVMGRIFYLYFAVDGKIPVADKLKKIASAFLY